MLTELSGFLDDFLKLALAILGILTLLAKLIVKLRPLFMLILASASLIIPHGFIAWIFIYSAVKHSDQLRVHSSDFLLLVGESAGLSILFTLVWGLCSWYIYSRLRARSRNREATKISSDAKEATS